VLGIQVSRAMLKNIRSVVNLRQARRKGMRIQQSGMIMKNGDRGPWTLR
jgi:hypothetical protein